MSSKKNELEISLPEGVELGVEGKNITVKSGDNELTKSFSHASVLFEKTDKGLKVFSESSKKAAGVIVNTIGAHVRNMIAGVTKGYEYKLAAAFSHFPMNIQAKEGIVEINNFAGEKKPRIARIYGKDTKVSVKGKDIVITGSDKDAVGQTAANLEIATKLRGKDLRVFQDGIYIVSRGFKEAEK